MWSTAALCVAVTILPMRMFAVWIAVSSLTSALSATLHPAHAYESDGDPLDRPGQLADSIDTPGAFWTELWAPVGLRYHALHHYFPGIPYHHLPEAWRRLSSTLAPDALYRQSSSPGLTTPARLVKRRRQLADADGSWARLNCVGVSNRPVHFGIVSPPVPGHIHPFGALGRELIARGHRVTFLQMADVEAGVLAKDSNSGRSV